MKCFLQICMFFVMFFPLLGFGRSNCTVMQLMTEQERERTGVQQLSKEQLEALNRWFARYCPSSPAAARKAVPKPLEPPREDNTPANLEHGIEPVGAVVKDNQLMIASEQAFGFEQKVSNQIEQLESSIRKVIKNPYGRFLITLENGQQWRQRETKKMQLKVGDAVRITPGVLGSYDLKHVPSGRLTKVRRVK